MKSSVLILILFLTFFFVKRDSLLDSGQELFFPKQISTKLKDFNSFQVSSWNHLIPKNAKVASLLCEDLKKKWGSYVRKSMCQTGPSDFLPLIEGYLSYQFNLFPAPEKKEMDKLSEIEMAKLSLLMGPEAPALMSIIRNGYREDKKKQECFAVLHSRPGS